MHSATFPLTNEVVGSLCVCQSVHGGGGVFPQCPLSGAILHTLGPYPPNHKSRWYASYWNAFLLLHVILFVDRPSAQSRKTSTDIKRKEAFQLKVNRSLANRPVELWAVSETDLVWKGPGGGTGDRRRSSMWLIAHGHLSLWTNRRDWKHYVKIVDWWKTWLTFQGINVLKPQSFSLL